MSDNNTEQQSLYVVSQYTKDLSFENVNSASQIQASANEQPQIDMQLKVEVDEYKEQKNMYRISLITNIQAKLAEPMFVVDLNYVGDFFVEGFSGELLESILYIECPRLLFPFARSIIASAVSDGGFPPLYIAPINFVELYQQQREATKQTLQ
jgi:preprotein translocase subunit SecB